RFLQTAWCPACGARPSRRLARPWRLQRRARSSCWRPSGSGRSGWRRESGEEALAASRVQVGSAETCWNCGRIASETCSGCSAARCAAAPTGMSRQEVGTPPAGGRQLRCFSPGLALS
uniref:RanBP2-type domain-containing protein n=1 Tax=Macrostomum lignano TaxID=282301 RepID=A0A1I8IDL2_9PLAT